MRIIVSMAGGRGWYYLVPLCACCS